MDQLRTELRRRQELKRRRITERSIEATRDRCRTLAGFVREAWHVVEPVQPYTHGWHIDAICEHLEAITYGEIIRLLMNVPPGTMKSLLTSVFWPAWEWGPAGLPANRYISTSYSEDYVKRDSRRMRDLVTSEWYQGLWPQTRLVRSGESSFENVSTGWREGKPFASLTGGRAHRVIIDDPHSTETAESDAERKRTIRIFRESVPSRMVDPEKSAIVIIMQRLHVEDVSGVALSLGLGYDHLMLPMEFEEDRRCRTSIGFTDPRTYEGELLFPERFPRSVIERDKVPMGAYAVAGQFQQRPTLREGGLFQRSWFNPVKAAPVGTRWVRYWDLAASKERLGTDPAYTVGLKMGLTPAGRYLIAHVVRLRDEGQGVRTAIKNTAEIDGREVEVGFPQDPGQAGKTQAKDLVAMLPGYVARAQLESGDKWTRAEPFAAQAEAGNVDILVGEWNEPFLDELANFPGGKFKDQVDAASGAFSRLIGARVFGVSETEFTVPASEIGGNGTIPSTWPRLSAIDMDPSKFAVLWSAYDRAGDTLWLYHEYVSARSEMAVHAEAMRKRGPWIPALFDMKANKRTEDEGERIAYHLADLDVEVLTANLDLAAAVEDIATRLATGRLKVVSTMTDWLATFRRMTRDEKGAIVEQDAHLIRATALIVSNLESGITENRAASDAKGYDPQEDRGGGRSQAGY